MCTLGERGRSTAAIKLNKDLSSGSTDHTETFDNPRLTQPMEDSTNSNSKMSFGFKRSTHNTSNLSSSVSPRTFEVEKIELYTFVLPSSSTVGNTWYIYIILLFFIAKVVLD